MSQKNASQQDLIEIDDLNSYLKEIKELYNEAISSDEEYKGEADLLMATIANLEDSLKGVKDMNTLDKRKQARILADVTLLQTIHTSFSEQDEFDEEDEEYLDEDEDEDDEDEDDEDEDEDEDDEEDDE